MFVAVAVLFNPFFPIRLPRNTWQYCDVVSASILLIGAFKMAENARNTETRVLVIGANHNVQRRQDTILELAPLRDQFEQRLSQIIKEQEIDLIAEEAGDDTNVWENLKKQDLFGEIVDSPVPTIAKTVADENGVRHEDVDVDVRVVDEDDLESIKKRGEAIAGKILKELGTAEKVIVIVGEKHRSDVVQCLKGDGMNVVSMHFPE